MVTIIFQKRVQDRLNELTPKILKDSAKVVREELNKEFGYIIEDGKIVGIEKEM